MRTSIARRLAVAATTLALGLAAVPAGAQAAPAESSFAGIPASVVAQADELVQRLGAEAIDPADYVCSTSTPLRDWLAAQKSDWAPTDQGLVDFVSQLPLLDTVLFPDEASSTFGPFTHQITKTFRDLGKFWDVDPRQIRLRALRSTMLLDTARLTRVFTVGFGFDAATSAGLAANVVQLVDVDRFDHGRHPAFTFNAFALDTAEIPGVGKLPPQIVLGDGVLAGFQAVGLSDVAPQAILAHEYAHHVQYQRNLFTTDLTGPEASRRTELMADGFAAYYLTHARGANMQWKRVQRFVQVFSQLGDCKFDAPAHHGTPNQRVRAAEWGYGVADGARKQGHVMPTLFLARLFEKQLPLLVAPDAPGTTEGL
ncbi:hypothetical protein JNUCC0626_25485 [Lentzea sp. JNUCC 0626]|uniref:hypothetical protein n=1 Tax=Lentzea sp. JNUCC 0626 TaxID=3367513 RepID=UPI0037492E32